MENMIFLPQQMYMRELGVFCAGDASVSVGRRVAVCKHKKLGDGLGENSKGDIYK